MKNIFFYDSSQGFPDFFYAEITIFGFLYWSFKVSLAYAIFYFIFCIWKCQIEIRFEKMIRRLGMYVFSDKEYLCNFPTNLSI